MLGCRLFRAMTRRIALSFLAALALSTSAYLAFEYADRAYPPPLPARLPVSVEVTDRDGRLLRTFSTVDGRWRLSTAAADVDPRLVDMLIAYEDKRFWDHSGIDPIALLRAAGQLAGNGRIVSGGSTLSMQLARLIEPRESRNLGAKLRQLFRALQIERRLTKQQILDRYLTLAPYGGNLEGVRAASLAYFGKEPKRLTTSEAALLVALPQLPERRRPDRNPQNARAARDRVLKRMETAGLMGDAEVARAAAEAVPLIPPRAARSRPACRGGRRAPRPLGDPSQSHAVAHGSAGLGGSRPRTRSQAWPQALGRNGSGRRPDGRNPG